MADCLHAPEQHVLRVPATAVVWLAMLPASGFKAIVWSTMLGTDPPAWMGFLQVSILAALVLLAGASPRWRPLRGYFLALTALAAGYVVGDKVSGALTWEGWQARMFANTLIHAVISCGFLALSLVGSGLTRRDVYLVKGDMAAPSHLPRWVPHLPWSRLGPLLMVILAVGLAIQLFLTVHPDLHLAGRALLSLPAALAFAAINAAQEEFRYRAVLLARLGPAVGSTQALLVTSVMFGLDHWFGHPAGPSGVLLAGFAGYLWGKSMIETRGSAWAWLIHAFQDVVIYLLIAAARG